MIFTRKARLYIRTRTRLSEIDVWSIYNRHAYIPLGSSYGRRGRNTVFHLFWDVRAQVGRLGLVAIPDDVLVSIWQTDFSLPNGVRRPADEDIVYVRTLYEERVLNLRERDWFAMRNGAAP